MATAVAPATPPTPALDLDSAFAAPDTGRHNPPGGLEPVAELEELWPVIARVVAKAPPLTAEQRERLAVILAA